MDLSAAPAGRVDEPGLQRPRWLSSRRDWRLSLRLKGVLAVTGLTLYLAVVGTVFLFQQDALMRDLDELARLHRLQYQLRDPGLAALAAAQESAIRSRSQTMTATVFAVGLPGIGLIGAVVVLFLSRITTDLDALRARAGDIIAGRRRRPIAVRRPDEVGELTGAINALAAALDARERDLEFERRKNFHREKMAAIGNLAAGVLTEIGNPIAAIDGYARAIRDDLSRRNVAPAEALQAVDALLGQVERLTRISHEIAEIAAPPEGEHQLVDLNAIVEGALRLLHYHPRARAIGIAAELDHRLPAIAGKPDRLGHLVMNLVANAIEAMSGYRAGEPGIRIATTCLPDAILLEVIDHGKGMTDAMRRDALEPTRIQRQPGRGTGLGLPLCAAIAAEHGGRIRLDSAPGGGTRATVRIPRASPGESDETGRA